MVFKTWGVQPVASAFGLGVGMWRRRGPLLLRPTRIAPFLPVVALAKSSQHYLRGEDGMLGRLSSIRARVYATPPWDAHSIRMMSMYAPICGAPGPELRRASRGAFAAKMGGLPD
ncbi:hypothetical protein B0H13DRAFT_1878370 [Mycena leptocephala]|nr:hypothetical protein B0H13DRAFT_1878370 [Mycena leptocephala]